MASDSKNVSKKSIYVFGDYLLMLIFPCAISVWYYGADALRTLGVSVVTGFVFDFILSLEQIELSFELVTM